jgi:hypothetical protein
MSLIQTAGEKFLALKQWVARTFLLPTTTTILRWPPDTNDGSNRNILDHTN